MPYGLLERPFGVFDAGLAPDERHGGDVDSQSLDPLHRGEALAPEAPHRTANADSLRKGHAGEWPDERPRPAGAYFHDGHQRTLARDDVQLEGAETNVPREDREPLDEQAIRDGDFRVPPELGAGHCAMTPWALPQLPSDAVHVSLQTLSGLNSVPLLMQ